MTLVFDNLPPQIYVSKDVLNNFLVNSSPKNSLERAKNVVFFLFCILVDKPMGRGGGGGGGGRAIVTPAPLPGYATGQGFIKHGKRLALTAFMLTLSIKRDNVKFPL